MIDYLGIFTRKLSENVIFALRAEENQMLDAIRLLESLVQPFEHDWVMIPLDTRTQCTHVNYALSIVAADMYVISRVAILTGKPRSEPSDFLLLQDSDVQPAPTTRL